MASSKPQTPAPIPAPKQAQTRQAPPVQPIITDYASL